MIFGLWLSFPSLQVGYTVRFDDVTSEDTRILFLTDGMLLREAMADVLLRKYSFVILDEAHERTIHTDVLLGVVKAAQRRRKELKKPLLRVSFVVARAGPWFPPLPRCCLPPSPELGCLPRSLSCQPPWMWTSFPGTSMVPLCSMWKVGSTPFRFTTPDSPRVITSTPHWCPSSRFTR